MKNNTFTFLKFSYENIEERLILTEELAKLGYKSDITRFGELSVYNYILVVTGTIFYYNVNSGYFPLVTKPTPFIAIFHKENQNTLKENLKNETNNKPL